MTNIENNPNVVAAIKAALEEDGAYDDATTKALVDPEILASAEIVTRDACRTAGATIGRAVFHALDPALVVNILVQDGTDVESGATLLHISGSAASILAAERTALNFMQRMTGIATATRVFVNAVKGTKCRILDTRKTVPGLRLIDKYSVKTGGGTNHRMGLHDMILIKDNHRKLWRQDDMSRLDLAVEQARKKFPKLPIEVEVEDFDELRSALAAKPDWIMLDNMPPDEMREAVAIVNHACKLEASGGIDEAKIRAVAESGVDAISLGCLTHSVKAADLSLEIVL